MDYGAVWDGLVPQSDIGNGLKFIDLFAGIGGFHVGLSRLGAHCVMTSEIDKDARTTYLANHETDLFVGDIQAVHESEVPDHDILCGGFPCQPFSQAGKKQGFEDTRGTLFFDIARIMKEKRPTGAILENVRNIVKHDGGKTFEVILGTLDEIGYDVAWKIVKASDYGVPQHRPRAYIVAFDRERGGIGDFQFPEPTGIAFNMTDVFGKPCEKEVGFTLRVGGRRSGYGDRHNWDCYMVDGKEHVLTLDEALKMLGFPPGFKIPVSAAAGYKQVGNSVAAPAVYAIGNAMMRRMGEMKTAERSLAHAG